MLMLSCMVCGGQPRKNPGAPDMVNMDKGVEQLNTDVMGNDHENVTITIPVKERNLLNVIVKKFGWACML